jgi:hypothetical protein
MPVAYVSGNSTTRVSTTDSTSFTITVNAPPTITAENLLLAFVYQADTDAAMATLAGWTRADFIAPATGGGGCQYVLWKYATGSEPASYVFSWTAPTASPWFLSAVVVQYSGVAASDPVNAVEVVASTANSTSIVAPSIPATAAGVLVCGFASWLGNTTTVPAGMTARQNPVNATNTSLRVVDQPIAAETTGTRTSTQSSSTRWSASSVVLAEAAENPTTTVGNTRTATWQVAASPDFYSDVYSDVYGANPAPPLTTVGNTRTATWQVAATPDYYSDVYSDTYGAGPPPPAPLVTVGNTRTATWSVDTIGVVTVSRSASWSVGRIVTGSRAASWSVWNGPIANTRTASWAVFGLALPTTAIATPGMRLRVFLPNGADQGNLPTPESGNVAYPLNDVGALTFSYALRAPRASLLGQPCEISVEVTPDGGYTWLEPPNSRFVYVTDGADPLDPANKYSVQCKSLVWRLSKSVVLPNNLLNADGKRAFLSANVGIILKTLFTEAQARGSMTGIDHASFSTVLDSGGQAWGTTLTKYYEPGINYLAVLQDFADSGLCDFKMQGRSLYVYRADTTLAVDRTVGGSQVTFRAGRDLTDAPFTRTWEGLANYAYFAGDGVNYEYTEPTAITPWGRQELFISNGSVSDPGTMAVLTQNELAQHDVERTQYTRGLDFTRATHRPFWDYGVGDYVWSTADGSQPARLRIRQLTLQVNAQGILAGNVVLNDRFIESDVRAARRIQGITNGAQSGTGTGTPPVTDNPDGTADSKAPAKVLGLSGASTAYMGPGGFPQAQVTLTWGAVTTNVDGTPITDLDHYEIHRRPVGSIPPTQPNTDLRHFATTTNNTYDSSPYIVGSSWFFSVKAVDTSGNRSELSAEHSVGMATDNTAPQAPAAPVLTAKLGLIQIFWSGLPATGVWPPDFAYVEVHVSTVNNFTPTDATLFDTLYGEGSSIYTAGAYGVPVYAKLVAVDKTPLKSGASTQGTATPVQLVNTDLITGIVNERLLAADAVTSAAIADLAVGTANIINGSIVNAKIGSLAVNDANIAAMNVGKLSAGTLNAEVLVANRLTTSMSGSRVQMDSTGLRMFRGSETQPIVFLDPTPGQLIIRNTTDASHTSSGHGIQFGESNNLNVIIDNNEIMARNNAFYATLGVNLEGGGVTIGGRMGGFTDANRGSIPNNDNHHILMRGNIEVQNIGSGNYDDPYSPFIVGWRASTHLFMTNNKIGASGGLGANPLYINPRSTSGEDHFQPVWMGCDSIAIRRIGPAQGGVISTEAGVALQLVNGQVNSRSASIVGNCSMGASAFNVLSQSDTKHMVSDLAGALETVRGVKSKRWQFRDEINPEDQWHYGPMLEDLPDELRTRVGDDQQGYSISSLVGLLWEAVRELAAEVERGKER